MSRRRKSKDLAGKPAPNDGTKWGHLSDAELVREFAAELARRRMADGPRTLEDIETLSEGLAHSSGEEIQAATIAALPPEDGTPRPCPKCGKPTPEKADPADQAREGEPPRELSPEEVKRLLADLQQLEELRDKVRKAAASRRPKAERDW